MYYIILNIFKVGYSVFQKLCNDLEKVQMYLLFNN